MNVIHAIFEKGIFRPTVPVDLPEGCEVTIVPKPAAEAVALSPYQRRLRELLRPGEDTGDPFLSERHDEHQP